MSATSRPEGNAVIAFVRPSATLGVVEENVHEHTEN
jgi:hypothetical protein